MSQIMNLIGAANAEGLEPDDSALIKECVRVISENYSKHMERRNYYHDRVEVKNRGMDVAKAYKDANFSTGWGAKTVNALAERSIFDSFTFEGEAPEGFERAMRDNDVSGSYQMALPSMLTEGVGFWTVTGDDDGSPIVNYYDACTASGIWDWKRKRLKACFVVNDFAKFSPSSSYVPSECVLYTDEANIVISRTKYGRKNAWVAEYIEHGMGAVMAAPMVYQRSNARPFGRSRISKACMCYIDRMMEELQNAAIQSDIFSVPMKFVLGSSDKQYTELAENVHKAYKAEMLVMTANDDGNSPSVGMLQSADMTPHIAYMDKMASLMASETCLPIATFGVAGNGYTSSDALRASTDDLVILARAMNEANARTMVQVAKLVLAVIGGKPLSELDENESTVTAHFQDPSMPSDAANADAMVKVVSAVPEFAGTEVFWEKLGYEEDDRRRIKSEIKANQARQQILITEEADAGAEQEVVR